MATGATNGTTVFYGTSGLAIPSPVINVDPYEHRDGFDLIWRQNYLQKQMEEMETQIAAIEQNANLSDTERMFAMQMAMNSWSAISNLRTNMLKTVSDTLKAVVRNVA